MPRTKISKADKNLGRRIRNARISKGMTLPQLASKLDITHQQLQKYEQGTNQLRINMLLRVCKVLKKETEYFLKDLQETPEPPALSERLLLDIIANLRKVKKARQLVVVNYLVKELCN